jgi:hypothetical protein
VCVPLPHDSRVFTVLFTCLESEFPYFVPVVESDSMDQNLGSHEKTITRGRCDR